MTPRFPSWAIKAETLETVVFILSPPTPSRLVLSFMPSLFVLVLQLLHFAISLCLPFLPITLTAFQLLLCLLHHRERITARHSLSLSFYATRVFVAPDVLTLDLSEHQLTCGLLVVMAVAVVTRRSIPRLVHSFAVSSGVAEAHTLRLLLVVLLAL
jgi:predicted membrane protein